VKPRVSIARLDLEYDKFLFATIGDDRNGLPLAVASVLGRMNLDPWHEAAALAALPSDLATRKLASLIEAVPHEPSKHQQSTILATRLIALLPDHVKSKKPERATGAGSPANRRPVTYVIWFAILCALLLGARFAAGSQLSAAHQICAGADPVESLRPGSLPSSWRGSCTVNSLP
jgi:hypothetical protein